MKAQVKATGEIIEIIPIQRVDRNGFITGSWYDAENRKEYKEEELTNVVTEWWEE